MNPIFRRALGPFYAPLLRARYSRPVRLAQALSGRREALKAVRSGRFGVDLAASMGFGALIAHSLLLHDYFEQNGIEGFIRAGSTLYGEGGEDVMARFYHRPEWPEDLPVISQTATEYLLEWIRPAHMPLSRAARMYARHFSPRNFVTAKVNELLADKEPPGLAIHFRGTDKFLESGEVGTEYFFTFLDDFLARQPEVVIVLATDTADFSKAIRAKYRDTRFVSFDAGELRSGIARHFSDLPPYEKGLEAIVNILLIAQAPLCVRTSSFLSSISALANPEQETITINRTLGQHQPFPEYEILAREAGLQ